MKTFYSQVQSEHAPSFEIYTRDERVSYDESPARATSILSALERTGWVDILPPADFGLEPILAVHSSRYLDYLRNAYTEWKDFSPVDGTAFIPYTFGIDRETALKGNIPDQEGFFMTDLSVPISAGTYQAALASVNCALSGAENLVDGERAAFALCRPPGHHAGREICGGYCFLNNAAVAANRLSRLGKVGILDIDYHAGNGTQDIFYNRRDVCMTSIHADPRRKYPRYAGYAQEVGKGAGAGLHQNHPLPAGTDDRLYLQTLDKALAFISKFSPNFLVVSAGMDIYKDDPLGDFQITRKGIEAIGERIGRMRLPTLVVLEGGYQIETLGRNITTLLSGLRD